MWKQNRFWLVIALLTFLTLYFLTVGFGNIELMETTRIFILGNFINVPNFYFFFTYLPLVFFTVFLIKAILDRLKNRITNKILIIFNSFFILQITYLTLKINWINETNSLDENTIKLWQNILHLSLPIQMFLIFVLVIVSWKGEKRSKTLKTIKE